MTLEQQARIKKAEVMRWRKPVHAELRWANIVERIWELQEECSNIRWMTEDEEILLEALDGDEEAAFEFRLAFADLSAECDHMTEELEEIRQYQRAYDVGSDEDGEDDPNLFDLFFVASDRGGELYGYDDYVEDYMPLQRFSHDIAKETAAKALKRLTKDQLLSCAGLCMDIARNYLALSTRYDHISGALDILRGQNEGYLAMVRHLEDAWAAADAETDGFRYSFGNALDKFDRALSDLPDRLWLE